MNEQNPFQAFINLVTFDAALHNLHMQVDQYKAGEQQLQEQQQAIEYQLQQTKNRIHQLRKEVDMYELKMKTLDNQLGEKKEYLERVMNPREYQSLIAEINAIKREQNDMEHSILTAWNKMETGQREYDALEKSVHNQLQEINGKREEVKKNSLHIQQEIAAKEKEREHMQNTIPQEWLEKYAIMRAKVADPVVPVINDSCSACFYDVIEQDLQELRKRKLLQCKECYRFLYLPQEHNGATMTNSSDKAQ